MPTLGCEITILWFYAEGIGNDNGELSLLRKKIALWRLGFAGYDLRHFDLRDQENSLGGAGWRDITRSRLVNAGG